MARIASLYLPWLGIVLENVNRLDYRKQITTQKRLLPRHSNLPLTR